MKPINLTKTLQDFLEAEAQQAGKEYFSRRQYCPPPTWFHSVKQKDWTPQEQQHVRTCPYCQKSIDTLCEMECPGVLTLVQYAADVAPDREAVRRHLENFQCELCNRRIKLGWIRLAAQLLHSGQRSLSDVEKWARSSALLNVPATLGAISPLVVTQGVPPGESTAGQDSSASAQIPAGLLEEAVSQDDHLRITITCREDGRLIIALASDRIADAGRIANVEIVQGDESTDVRVTLQASASGLAVAEYDLGPAALWPRLVYQGFEMAAYLGDLRA